MIHIVDPPANTWLVVRHHGDGLGHHLEGLVEPAFFVPESSDGDET